MKNNKLVSIITPSFNSERFIQMCIESVLTQTYNNWELLIVDDCSVDTSSKLIETYKDERIIFTRLEKKSGAAEARNIAIRKARGRYIAFLDADDLWHPNKLEKQIFFMSKNDIAFSFTTYQLISEDGLNKLNVIKAPSRINYHSYLKNTIIGCLTVIIDRHKTGDFEMPNIRSSHDMALWLLIMKRGFFAYGLSENLAQYRIVSLSNTANKIRSATDVWKVYREFENLSFLYSSWCFLHYAFYATKKRLF